MEQKLDSRLYVSMMVDSLKKKRDILVSVFGLTLDQEGLLKSKDMDADGFMTMVDSKGEYIDELGKLDDGFERLYNRFEAELISNRENYGNQIAQMKGLISDITDLSTRIQVMEKKNDERFRAYLSSEKAKIRMANNSRQTAMTYAQNMTDMHRPTDSYFINEKK